MASKITTIKHYLAISGLIRNPNGCMHVRDAATIYKKYILVLLQKLSPLLLKLKEAIQTAAYQQPGKGSEILSTPVLLF